MGAVLRRQLTGLLATLSMVAVLAALAFGLPAIDRSLPAGRPVDAGRPYAIGAGVTVRPPPGAVLDVTGTRPADDRGSVLFVLGQVRYAIVVQPFGGDLGAAAGRLRQRITGTAGYQVTGTELTVATGTGLPGLQGGYTAPGRGGRYAVFLVDGLAIEVTVSGDDPDLEDRLAAIETSTGTLRYEARR